jgi:hypothetical protein
VALPHGSAGQVSVHRCALTGAVRAALCPALSFFLAFAKGIFIMSAQNGDGGSSRSGCGCLTTLIGIIAGGAVLLCALGIGISAYKGKGPEGGDGNTKQGKNDGDVKQQQDGREVKNKEKAPQQPKRGVNRANYERIEDGMTLAEVEDILGRGKEGARSGNITVVTWQSGIVGLRVISITFEDGRATAKVILD